MNKLLFFLFLTSIGFSASFDVVQGTATSYQQENKQVIENSNGANLHWQDFSIQQGQIVHFAQEHAKSVVYNRVVGPVKSVIDGILSSNGRVFLINPNGVHVNANALVETAGFIASTLDITLNEEGYFFQNPGKGEIVNDGTIKCPNGDVIFIANTIRNQGSCEGHFIGLIADQEVVIKPHDTKHIYIKTDHCSTDESCYETAIHTGGLLSASSFEKKNGRIFLMAKEGTSQVDGVIQSESGEVRVLGKEVILTEKAVIDVSGKAGGDVLIGGSYQGSNPEIFNAKSTTAAVGSVVKANSTDAGNGGFVIYWSDGITTVGSQTDVSAGPNGGDGGFIEVSGEKNFFYRGISDRRAPLGKCGTILFDPEADVTVSGAADSNIVGAPNYLPTDSPANILNTGLQTELGLGDVTITTNGPAVTMTGNGDLDFTAAVTWNGPGSLTCTVGRDATISAPITNTGTSGGLTINAQRTIEISDNISLNGGDVTLTGGLGFPTDSYTAVTQTGFTGISTTQNGRVTITGTSGLGAVTGVELFHFFSISTEQGNVTVTGTCRDSSNVANVGVLYDPATTTINGDIIIRGTTPSQSSSSFGVLTNNIDPFLMRSTGSGSISVTGNADAGIGTSLGFMGTNCDTNTGSITIVGNSNSNRGIEVVGGPLATSTSGAIRFEAQGSPAMLIRRPQAPIETTGPISVEAIGNVLLQSTNFSDVILSPNGSAPFTANIQGNLLLDTASSGSIQIGSPNTSASAPINIQITGDLTLIGSVSGGPVFYAIIGHGDPTALASTLSGDINIHARSISLVDEDSNIASFTQIGHVNQTAGGSTIGGNIMVKADSDISLTGNGLSYARIGHGGQVGAATFLASTTQVTAGTNITLTQGTMANSNGPLTLILDNLFPSPPLFGAGSFSFDANSILSATGPLKIYTVSPNQNTISAPINGAVFTPGPFNVNSSTEEWSTYFADGSYEGAAFKFYYKIPIAIFIQGEINNRIASNLVALNNLLPVLRSPGKVPPNYPGYHFEACYFSKVCTPDLHPYGSFIFEDAVIWIPIEPY